MEVEIMKQKTKLALVFGFVFIMLISLAQVLAVPIKVACIGDSITNGYGVTAPYPLDLGQLLGSGYTVINYGVSSKTLLKNGDQPYWSTQQYTDSTNWLPDIVIIMLGSNDAKAVNWQYKSQFVTDYKDMINHYRNLSSHPIVYINTSPMVYNGDIGNYGITNPVVSGEVVPLTIQTANEMGCPVIDINTVTQGMPQNFPDYVHPNNAGYVIIANAVYQGLMASTTVTPFPTRTPTPSATPTPTPTPTPTGTSNLALNKTSSADSSQSGRGANYGNDGSTSTRWCANNGNTGHWWKVDLGSSRNITSTGVMWEFAKVYKYKVEVSTDNTNWTLKVDKTANTSTAQTQTDTFTATARYVRITITGLASGTWASLFEFRVFGN
jgi:lysophospholipase L1-like esterase